MHRETRFEKITNSFEIPMYYVAGMEVAETLGDVRQLATRLCVEQS